MQRRWVVSVVLLVVLWGNFPLAASRQRKKVMTPPVQTTSVQEKITQGEEPLRGFSFTAPCGEELVWPYKPLETLTPAQSAAMVRAPKETPVILTGEQSDAGVVVELEPGACVVAFRNPVNSHVFVEQVKEYTPELVDRIAQALVLSEGRELEGEIYGLDESSPEEIARQVHENLVARGSGCRAIVVHYKIASAEGNAVPDVCAIHGAELCETETEFGDCLRRVYITSRLNVFLLCERALPSSLKSLKKRTRKRHQASQKNALQEHSEEASDSKTDESTILSRVQPRRDFAFIGTWVGHELTWSYEPHILTNEQRRGLKVTYEGTYATLHHEDVNGGILVGPLEGSFAVAFRSMRTGKMIAFHHEFANDRASLLETIKKELDVRPGDVLEGEYYGCYSDVEWMRPRVIQDAAGINYEIPSYFSYCDGREYRAFVEDVLTYVVSRLKLMKVTCKIDGKCYEKGPIDGGTSQGVALDWVYFTSRLDTYLLCPMLNKLFFRSEPPVSSVPSKGRICLTDDIIPRTGLRTERQRVMQNEQLNRKAHSSAELYFKGSVLKPFYQKKFPKLSPRGLAERLMIYGALPFVEVPAEWQVSQFS